MHFVVHVVQILLQQDVDKMLKRNGTVIEEWVAAKRIVDTGVGDVPAATARMAQCNAALTSSLTLLAELSGAPQGRVKRTEDLKVGLPADVFNTRVLPMVSHGAASAGPPAPPGAGGV